MNPSSDLAALLVETANDPELYFRAVLDLEPRRWQASVLREIRARLLAGDRHIRVLIRSCFGAGKTTLAAGLGMWWTSTHEGARGIVTAPSWASVEGIVFNEIGTLYRGSLLGRAGVGRLLSTSFELAPGWDLVGVSSDRPETLEGRHSRVGACRIVDEAKAVDVDVFEATEGLLDAPETLDVFISTPGIPFGRFFDRDMKGGVDVIRAVVTIDDLIAEGLEGKADWKARRLEEWGEASPWYQSRALARYIGDAEDALFPFAWVERAMAADFDVDLQPVAGLDVAGSIAGDESALAILSGPDEAERWRVHEVTSWSERDTAKTRGRVLAIVREMGAARLGVDVVGLGKGVADALREEFPRIDEFRASDRAQESERFANRKAAAAWELRELLEAGRIRLPNHPKLKAQLVAMKYAITSRGQVRVVDPADSPDLVDAVLIGMGGGRHAKGAAYMKYLERQVAEKRAGELPAILGAIAPAAAEGQTTTPLTWSQEEAWRAMQRRLAADGRAVTRWGN